MDELSNTSRCARFIEAFNNMAKQHYGPKGTLLWAFPDCSLGYNRSERVVQMYWGYKNELQGTDILPGGPVFFDPAASDEDNVVWAVEAFEPFGYDDAKLVGMLKAARLISPEYDIDEDEDEIR